MHSKLRQRIATSPIARGAAIPLRTMMVARYDARLIGRSVDWLVRGRDWAERTGRHYPFFKEQPLDHWWPGDGIGAAWTARRPGQLRDQATGIDARPSG